jgi:hypothetical protein
MFRKVKHTNNAFLTTYVQAMAPTIIIKNVRLLSESLFRTKRESMQNQNLSLAGFSGLKWTTSQMPTKVPCRRTRLSLVGQRCISTQLNASCHDTPIIAVARLQNPPFSMG